MSYRYVKINQALAQQYLDILTKNRTVRKDHIIHLTKTILSGEWRRTGEAIRVHGKLNKNNVPANGAILLDGQHRLKAFIASEKKLLSSEIIDDLPADSFEYMDQGRPRSAGDVLVIAGYKNTNVLSGVARSLYLFEKGGIKSYFINSRGGLRRVTNHDILDYVTKNEKALHLAIKESTRHMSKISMSLSTHGAAYHLFKKRSLNDCEKFFYLLGTGEKLTKTNPIHLLRSILIDHRVSRKNAKRMNIHKRDLMMIMILTWNAFRDKRRLADRSELLDFDTDNLPKSIK